MANRFYIIEKLKETELNSTKTWYISNLKNAIGIKNIKKSGVFLQIFCVISLKLRN